MYNCFYLTPEVFNKTSDLNYFVNIGRSYNFELYFMVYPKSHQNYESLLSKNLSKVDNADFIIIDLNDFRTFLPEPNAILLCGYALSQNKKIFGFITSELTYRRKIMYHNKVSIFDSEEYDNNEYYMEGYGFQIPFSLYESLEVEPMNSFDKCLKYIYENYSTDIVDDVNVSNYDLYDKLASRL